MQKLISAKIFFSLCVLLLVAKPFLGFSLFSRHHPPALQNIFVKAFTKRKPEDPETIKFASGVIQKKLTEAAQKFSLRFTFLLSLFFSFGLLLGLNITERYLRLLLLDISFTQPFWLLNRKLII